MNSQPVSSKGSQTLQRVFTIRPKQYRNVLLISKKRQNYLYHKCCNQSNSQNHISNNNQNNVNRINNGSKDQNSNLNDQFKPLTIQTSSQINSSPTPENSANSNNRHAEKQQIQQSNQQQQQQQQQQQLQQQQQQQQQQQDSSESKNPRESWLELGRLICKELGLFQDVDKFKVPWGFSSIIKVLFWWILSFLFVGQCCIPYGCKLLCLDRNNLSPRGAATLHLLLDTLQIAITYLILAIELRPFKPFKQKFFPFRLRPIGWLFLVGIGCLLFPCVDWLALVCSRWFPVKEDNWVENIEQSFQIGDAFTHSLYLFVVSLCAPLWEETIFRGFLIPSLSRYMPLGISVLTSSLIFGLAHFSLQRVLPLMLLGVVIGAVYVASGNLLSAVVLHSLWNFWVFWQLFAQHVVGQDQWSFTSFVVKLVATLWSACNGIWP